MLSLIALLLVSVPPSGALDVLIIDDGDSNTSVLSAELRGRGHTLTNSQDDLGFTEDEFEGDEVDLSAFDAVIWLDGFTATRFEMPEKGQEALRDYVDGGGGLLLFGSSGYEYAAYGFHSTLADLIPLRSDTTGAGDGTIICLDDSHRVAEGWSLDEETVVSTGGIVVDSAAFGDVIFGVVTDSGEILDGIVATELGDGRSVQYGFWGNATAAGLDLETDWADDPISALVENGLQWVVQRPPVVTLSPSWIVAAGDSRTMTPSSAYDPDGGDVSLSWDLGGDGTEDGTGDSYEFSATDLDGPTSETVVLTATDDEGETASATATVTVNNVAPVIEEVPSPDVVDEGTDQELALVFSDVEAADTHVVHWDFGDGEEAEGNPVTHAWRDEARYTVTVTVTDDDGGSDSASFAQAVTNVAPVLSGDPPTTATRGETWSFTPTVEDPGVDDVLSFGGTWPPDASLDPDTGTLTWTPDLDAVGREHTFVLTVSDGDGGEDSMRWKVMVELDDGDGDGMSDAWEESYGLDPTNPDDAADDPDGDGRTNLDEFTGDSDPTAYEGPSQPTLLSPIGGEEVTDPPPTLTVLNADAPLGQTVTYSFQVYSDPDLTDLVASVTGRREGESGQTSWSISGVSLVENADYWWTASAADAYVETPPVEPAESFFVNVVNEAPEVPELVTPFDGGIVDSLTPQLVVQETSDPDRDPLTYGIQLSDDEGNPLASASDLLADGGTVAWVPDVILTDETTYCWTAWAVDDEGLESSPAPEACFFVDLENDPPSAPTILSPAEDELVPTLSPTITVEDGVDPEGRALIEEFQVDVTDSFDSKLLQVGQVEVDEDGTTAWVPPDPLTEDTRWFVRVRSNDGGAASDWVSRSFLVSADNGPPSVPGLVFPATGDAVEPTPTLTVANASDPEGQPLTYDFEVRDRSGVVVAATTGVAEGSDGETSWTTSALSAGVYAWTARSVDVDGGASAWAEAVVFAVDGEDSGPSGTGDTGGVGLDTPTIAGEGCGCASEGPAARGLAGLFLVWGAMLGVARRRR
ncbi:MAG: PKD domain-containing protein [Deltaproteobacteria bacterium]|nr:MAG: PKD domain-containing protein [Deltaproteobacteria bacterium]